MTVVVESSTDQVAAALNHGIFPVPPEVAADNAKREGKDEPKVEVKVDPAAPAKPEEPKDEAGDDVEGDDGLTPRQKREFTKAMQATIGKKHRMQREAEEYAAIKDRDARAAQERADKLETDLQALREQLKPAKVEDSNEPDRKAFKEGADGDQEYWNAMVDFRVEKRLRTDREAAAKSEQERFQQEETDHAQAKMDRAFEQGPDDFKEVYESADMVLPNWVLEAIKTSDLMAELSYYFGNHRDEAEKIRAMTDGLIPKKDENASPKFVRACQRQLVALGKIESTLTPFSKEKVKSEVKVDDGDKPSKTDAKSETDTGSAPSKPRVNAPIIKPLNGGSSSQVERDEADLTSSQATQRWAKKNQPTLLTRKRH